MLDDDMVLRAMDREGGGAFVPVGRTSTGKLRKSRKLADLEKLGRIERRIEKLVGEMAAGLYAGGVDARPLVKQNSRPCDWCDYRSICRHVDGRNERQVAAPKDAFEAESGEEGSADA